MDSGSIPIFMGRSFQDTTSGRSLFWCVTAYYFTDSYRNLFYDQNKIFAGSSFWRYGSRAYREKEGRWQSVDFSDTDRLNCNKSRNGKSGWSSRCRFRRRCRCGILDWITAIIGSSTAFIEATLAQLYKEKDPLYGGYRGGPAYYMHHYVERRTGKTKKHVCIAVLFAISGLICWAGISQVISNSVASSFENAFGIPPIFTTVILVVVAAVIVLRKNATVKVLDILVPIMAVCYFVITIVIILLNIRSLPGVFERIIQEAFGIRQAAAGGFGAVLMNGVKRGLFSNEAGSGSAPCAAAAAECDTPVKAGFIQALGVFIDTIVICSCTAMIMLLVPEKMIAGLEGMELLQTAMNYHLGKFGVIFIAVTLFLFSFSTFLGILFYARGNVAYLLGDKWCWQTAYKILALVMLFIGGIAAYHIVWDLGDVGIGLMTIFNIVTLYPMGGEALEELRKYEKNKQ